MKPHVLHPLWVAIAVVGLILLGRIFLVPDDFGVHGRNFTYGFHRLSNIEEWQNFPIKYQGWDSCTECHRDNVRMLRRSPHRSIECENCHGPAVGHPDEIAMLPRNTDRELCLRCHAFLEYPNSARAVVPPINPRLHFRRQACVECHVPHDPREFVQ